MANPWLSIPLADYEGHMGAAHVGQLDGLAELFKRALDVCMPKSVAVLGVAGGNGLEQIDPRITKRTIGLDINPRYLEVVRQRYGGWLPGLELCCADLGDLPGNLAPVELVHAALIFEHTGLGRCLESALSLVAPGGRLSAVLQLLSDAPDVTPSSYASMQTLQEDFTLIDLAEFDRQLQEKGFRLLEQEQRSLPSGKALWLGICARRTEP
jgi:methyltransferase family protein